MTDALPALVYSFNITECNMTVNESCPFQMHGGSAKFSDLYELQEDIGVGSYSICKRCVHRVSAMDYAVKVTSSVCDRNRDFRTCKLSQVSSFCTYVCHMQLHHLIDPVNVFFFLLFFKFLKSE